MIPAWKVKRELVRLQRQITGLPKALASIPARLAERRQVARHDRDFEKVVQITQGELKPAQKYVIFLLYQPKGVPESVFVTLDYLIGHGYAPIIVINGAVPAEHLAGLRRCAWLVVQRPNLGYDFGGYRDGLRVLQERVASLERLIVMNDSIWFPMGGDPIREVEDLADNQDLDAAGLNQIQKIRRLPDGSVRYEDRHIESYFYLFASRFWASDAFRQFWASYRMSSNKPYTIKYGEIGFSKQMMGLGYRFSGLLRLSDFLEEIEHLSTKSLHEALIYATKVDDDLVRQRDELILTFEENDLWRQRALQHIRTTALRRPFNTSFCVTSDRLFGTHYLKKQLHSYFCNVRSQYLRAVKDGVLDAPPPVILRGVKNVVAEHDPKTAERTL